MTKGRIARCLGGKTRTIPADKVPQYEAVEALEFRSEHERRAALEAAASYLIDAPPELRGVHAEIIRPEDAKQALAESTKLIEEHAASVLAAVGPAAELLRESRARIDGAIAAARTVAALAVGDGVSEVAVAKALGVDRLTLRRWLGKQDRKQGGSNG